MSSVLPTSCLDATTDSYKPYDVIAFFENHFAFLSLKDYLLCSPQNHARCLYAETQQELRVASPPLTRMHLQCCEDISLEDRTVYSYPFRAAAEPFTCHVARRAGLPPLRTAVRRRLRRGHCS